MAETYRIPLLKDHHNHLSYYALLQDCINLGEVREKAEALRILNRFDPGQMSVALGWNSSYYEFEAEELMDLPPVIIVNVSLHNFLMSPSAEDRLREVYPEIIANYKDPVWFDDHMPLMLAFVPAQIEPTPDKFERFFDDLYRQGVYHIEEMHLPGEKIYQILKDSPFFDRTAFWTDPDTYQRLGTDTRKGVKGIKLFTDGALGARTAALKAPYLDGATAGLLYTDKALYDTLREVSSAGLSAAVHAIGDLATTQVVNIVAQLKKDGYGFPQIRMEHCQFIDESNARKARDLGMVFSMQPNFSTDSTVYTDRLPRPYLESSNPFRMLIDHAGFIPGENLLLGSDGMPHGAKGALDPSLFPPMDGQRLTLDEFTAAYCMPDQRHGHLEFSLKDQGPIAWGNY
jgi:predicted amidohydrolase YtcJ